MPTVSNALYSNVSRPWQVATLASGDTDTRLAALQEISMKQTKVKQTYRSLFCRSIVTCAIFREDPAGASDGFRGRPVGDTCYTAFRKDEFKIARLEVVANLQLILYD